MLLKAHQSHSRKYEWFTGLAIFPLFITETFFILFFWAFIFTGWHLIDYKLNGIYNPSFNLLCKGLLFEGIQLHLILRLVTWFATFFIYLNRIKPVRAGVLMRLYFRLLESYFLSAAVSALLKKGAISVYEKIWWKKRFNIRLFTRDFSPLDKLQHSHVSCNVHLPLIKVHLMCNVKLMSSVCACNLQYMTTMTELISNLFFWHVTMDRLWHTQRSLNIFFKVYI